MVLFCDHNRYKRVIVVGSVIGTASIAHVCTSDPAERMRKFSADNPRACMLISASLTISVGMPCNRSPSCTGEVSVELE